MIPQSFLCRRGDGHRVTEGEKRGKRDEEETEVDEATTVTDEIRGGLERQGNRKRVQKKEKSKRFSILC